MALLSLRDVTVSFGGDPVLDAVSLSIQPHDRACVTGRNGEGKSTLLKVIAGIQPPDSGEVIRAPRLKVTYLPQDVPEDRAGTVEEIIEAAIPHDDDRHHPGADLYLTRLELPGCMPFNALSGGYRRRVLLACALAGEPGLLLLDEPTNHLDIDSIQWLENWLREAECACLFITHDRSFLKNVAKSVFDLDRGQLAGWDCDYPTFVRRKEELLADESVYWERKARKLSQEEIWLRRGVKARTTRNEGRVEALRKLRSEFAARRTQQGVSKLALSSEGPSGDLVVKVEGVRFGYDPAKPIVNGFSARIMRGERIGIIGPNGSGKTTLLRLLLGQIQPQTGSVALGARVETAFFDQLRTALNPELTVLENLAEGKDEVTVGGVKKHVYGYLQDFLFTPERSRTPVKALSGGERARLLLARLFLNPGNLLVLDEPTNDLDIETLELLEEQLAAYTGTLLLVSHDRTFLDRVVTASLVLEGEGRVNAYPGGYEDWLRQRKETVEPEKAGKPAAPPPPRRDNNATRLSYKEQRQLEELPLEIAALEAEIAALTARMSDPAAACDPAALAQVGARLAQAEARYEICAETWLALEERAQSLK